MSARRLPSILARAPGRLARRALLPPDTFERHALAARLALPAGEILDVGGAPGLLELFVPVPVTTANVEPPADVVYDGVRLPFADRSFAVVTSLDVLEHVPRGQRAGYVAELLRVAAVRVVVSCPLGGADHERSERELADWYERVAGRRHRFLDEHLARGLPTEPELRGYVAAAAGFDCSLAFHGDFREVQLAFRLGVLARARRRPGDLARFARTRIRRLGAPAAATAATAAPTPWTNRVFLVARRADALFKTS